MKTIRFETLIEILLDSDTKKIDAEFFLDGQHVVAWDSVLDILSIRVRGCRNILYSSDPTYVFKKSNNADIEVSVNGNLFLTLEMDNGELVEKTLVMYRQQSFC